MITYIFHFSEIHICNSHVSIQILNTHEFDYRTRKSLLSSFSELVEQLFYRRHQHLRVWSTILLTGTRKGQPPVGGWIHRKNFSAYFFRAALRYSAGNNPVLCLKSWANRPALLYPIVLAICIIVKSVDTSSISAWLNLR